MPFLDLDQSATLYATHGLQSYAAKCPPALVRYGLRYYSKPNELVLDPMVGSGTTLVEASLLGRHAIGYDIDPLARLIAEVKGHPLDDVKIATIAAEIIKRASRDLDSLKSNRHTAALNERATPPEFRNRDHWFHPQVAEQLALLSHHIGNAKTTNPLRDFLWVAFASTILAKHSVANARDIIHSRTHYYKHGETPDVIAKFTKRIEFMRKKMAEYRALRKDNVKLNIAARIGDARNLRLDDESVDLVFTSPPYATALDYTRAHFLAVAWMQNALDLSFDEYRALGARYIGSERGEASQIQSEEKAGWTRANQIVKNLQHRSPHHARLIQRYWCDMAQVLCEMQRVLKDRRHVVLVVCPSHIRQVQVPTHHVLTEMGNAIGLHLKRRYTRTIYRHRRMLPYLQDAFGKRMTTEYVLIFQKV